MIIVLCENNFYCVLIFFTRNGPSICHSWCQAVATNDVSIFNGTKYECCSYRHLGIFDLIRSEDEKELASRYDTVGCFHYYLLLMPK